MPHDVKPTTEIGPLSIFPDFFIFFADWPSYASLTAWLLSRSSPVPLKMILPVSIT